MRCRWRRSRPQPAATSSRLPAAAAPAGTAAPMAAAAATTPGPHCTPARAAGTPAPSAAAAPTGREASASLRVACSPDERSDIRDGERVVPGCRCAHPGYEAALAVTWSPPDAWSEAIPIALHTGIDGYRFAPPILRKHAFAISRRIAPE